MQAETGSPEKNPPTDAFPVSAVDLAAIVQSRGIVLQDAETGIKTGMCPFCGQDAPAFVVTPDRVRCERCSWEGDAAAFMARFDGLSVKHAREIVAAGAALMAVPERKRIRTTVRRLPNPLANSAFDISEAIPDIVLLERAASFYHGRMRASPAAMAFLCRLGPDADDAVEHFRIGFADRTLGYRIPWLDRKAGLAWRVRLQRVGLYRTTGREHLYGCLVIPVPCGGGVSGLFGFRIGHDRRDVSLTVTPEGPKPGVWNGDALNGKEIVLATDALDALALWSHGVRHVTFSVTPLKQEDSLYALLARRHVRCAILAYPASLEGEDRVLADAATLAGMGIGVRRVRFPWNMNARSIARMPTDSGHMCLPTMIDTASWIAGPAQETEADAALPAMRVSTLGDLEQAFGTRAYRIAGLARNRGFGTLRASVRLRVPGPEGDFEAIGRQRVFIDRFDLTRDLSRQRFVARACQETGVDEELIRGDLGRLLLTAEQWQHARLAGCPEPPGRDRVKTPVKS